MANVKVVLNSKGIRELLKSQAIEDELTERMRRVETELGSQAELYVTQGPTRVAVKVARGSDFDEANTGEMSRALDLAGGRRGTQVKTPKPRRGA